MIGYFGEMEWWNVVVLFILEYIGFVDKVVEWVIVWGNWFVGNLLIVIIGVLYGENIGFDNFFFCSDFGLCCLGLYL